MTSDEQEPKAKPKANKKAAHVPQPDTLLAPETLVELPTPPSGEPVAYHEPASHSESAPVVETPDINILAPDSPPVDVEPESPFAAAPVLQPAPALTPPKPAYGKAGILGGVVGAVVASGVFLAAPKMLPSPPPDATLAQQIAALQAAVKTNETSPKALASLQEPLAALDGRINAVEGKVMELVPSRETPAVPDSSGLEQRLAKLETAQTATKAENRVIMEQTAASKSDASASLAIATQALAISATRGAPFAAEFAAAENSGADKLKLAAIKPFAAAGLPDNATLAAELNTLAKAAAKSAPADAPKSYWEKLSSGALNLVKIRSRDTPEEASIAPIAALLSKGALSDAIALQAKLPEPLLSATKPWAEKAASRAGAEAAIQGLWSDALTNLTKPKN